MRKINSYFNSAMPNLPIKITKTEANTMKSTISSLISLTVALSAIFTVSSAASANPSQKSHLSPNTESKEISQIFGSKKSKRPGDNYVGLATVIGGEQDFMDASIISKVKVLNLDSSKSVSVRPSVVFTNGDLDLRIPATVDITRINRDLGELNGRITPYGGGGVAIDSNGDTDLMLTAGMDIQLTPKVTATTSANVLFLGRTEFDATVGIGYNF